MTRSASSACLCPAMVARQGAAYVGWGRAVAGGWRMAREGGVRRDERMPTPSVPGAGRSAGARTRSGGRMAADQELLVTGPCHCRLPETWDHPRAVLARNMGPADGVVCQKLGTTS